MQAAVSTPITKFPHSLLIQYAGWVAVPAVDTIRKTICRASNRVFVGLPKCRKPDYVDLNVEFTTDAVIAAVVVCLFPPIVKR